MISISVVIPAFNREKTIRYCLDSLLCQTLLPFEIIVVDDCSTDDTKQLVESFGGIVRCIGLKKNSGAQAARNQGIREAKGDWIAFQDSDDAWLPDKLERQVAALQTVDFDPMTVVHGNALSLETKTGVEEFWDLPVMEGREVYPLLLQSSGPFFQAMLTSRAALEAIGLLDENVPSYQEWDTAIRLGKECRFIHLKDPLFIYYLHEGETISKGKMRDIQGYQYIIDKYKLEILRVCGATVFNGHIEYNAIRAMNFGYFKEAGAILKKGQGVSVKFLIFKCHALLKIQPTNFLHFLNIQRNFLDRIRKRRLRSYTS